MYIIVCQNYKTFKLPYLREQFPRKLFKVTVHTGAETIQGRKLFTKIRYFNSIPIDPHISTRITKKIRRFPHFFQVSKGNTSVVDPSSGRAIYQIEQDSMTSLQLPTFAHFTRQFAAIICHNNELSLSLSWLDCPELLGLGRQIGQINSGAFWVIFYQTIRTHFGTV